MCQSLSSPIFLGYIVLDLSFNGNTLHLGLAPMSPRYSNKYVSPNRVLLLTLQLVEFSTAGHLSFVVCTVFRLVLLFTFDADWHTRFPAYSHYLAFEPDGTQLLN